uniref:Uncharacterized protein n=1 Tax=Strigamia maritima TaxID=126957 RepID=T1JAT5_STRMM
MGSDTRREARCGCGTRGPVRRIRPSASILLAALTLALWKQVVDSQPTVVPEPPGKPFIMGFTSRSVNLSWAPILDPKQSPILHYAIRIRVGENGEWNNGPAVVAPGNESSFEVRELQPFTVYSFRVQAVNAVGFSKPSKESYYMVTLREVPEGKPEITSAHNVSDSSIQLEWIPPDKSTVHGEFQGYRISFRPRELNDQVAQEVILRDPNTTSYILKNLDTFRQYVISVQVFNPAGAGPASTVVAMTDEGMPGKPQNMDVARITDAMVKLKWGEPTNPNGVIQGYNLYCQHGNVTDIRTIRNPHTKMEYLLTDLNPYTNYTIWVRAFTSKNEGEASDHLHIRTDVQAPSAPYIVNLTCQSDTSLFLQWERPHSFYHQINYYYIYYKLRETWEYEEITIETSNNKLDHMILIPNLTSNAYYEVKVRGGTRSLIDQAKVYRGPFSDTRHIFCKVNITRTTVPGRQSSTGVDDGLGPGIIAGIVCASLALLIAVLIFLIWRKCFQANYYYLDDPPPLPKRSPNMAVNELYDESDYQSIPVHLWAIHVARLHADGDIGFSKEYEAIQQATVANVQFDQSQDCENKTKNRYLNIVAYDHTRVTLRQLPGLKRNNCDYINANYIDGYNKPRAYIGTQGPLPSTIPDFWRMVWEQRVVIIVMITNLVERGRRKCDMYWPKDGQDTYGFIQVTVLGETVMATYTVRTFSIRNIKIKKKHQSERIVYQYHYTNWPDHGVPEHPLPVLSFVRKSAAANPDDAGPIIVHCSAGVGRTGTYIVLDAMLQQIKYKGDLNVYGFLKHIRQQRNYLVQTEEQYIFIHDALLEAIESGDTDVPVTTLNRYVQTLQTANDLGANEGKDETCNAPAWQLLEKQFKLGTSFVPKDFHLMSATKTCNQGKIRSTDFLPIESHRVHITPKPGTEGSDFINASFVPGFTKLKEFIITQHPLPSTVADFWQMVWDHNAQTIVLLSPEWRPFWPLDDDVFDFETFKVKYSSVDGGMTPVTRDFLIQSTQDDYELLCRILHSPNWPQGCIPLSSAFDLIRVVQQWHQEYQNGPIIVVDRYGGTEAATFSCLTLLQKQMQLECHVDVYQHAKLYHMKRPGVWKSQDDYLFLYRALESASAAADSVVVAFNAPNGHIVNGNGHIPNTVVVINDGGSSGTSASVVA